MNRLSCLNSAEQLLAFFTGTASTASTASTVAASRRGLLRLSPTLRSFSFTRHSHRRLMDPSSPTATTGMDDFVHVDKGDQIPVEYNDNTHRDESGTEATGLDGGGRFYDPNILPPDLSRNVVRLSCESTADGGVCDVYLVGTAHVSTESCREVRAVIDILKPQVVFLELCSSRIAFLKLENVKVPTFQEMLNMWKKNQNPFGILYGWFLAKVGSKLEVLPGAEFRAAYEEAMKYGAKVILGDRPAQITLRRTWVKMPFWHKTKLVYGLLFQGLFLPSPEVLNKALKDMDDVDVLTYVVQETGKHFPTLIETLLHERDQYMSAMLLRVASQHNSVVAVVGKGHLTGIQKNWKQPVEVMDLLSIPSKTSIFTLRKIVTTIGVTVAGVAIISGIYIFSKK